MTVECRSGYIMDLSTGRTSEKALENPSCPRCQSSKTKFCYYNNYNLSQPRYYCKSCRRYWTLGGSLRNIPAGGTSRKNSYKRRLQGLPTSFPSSSSSSSSSALKSPPSTVSPVKFVPVTDNIADVSADTGTFAEMLAEPMLEGFNLDIGLGLGGLDEIGLSTARTTTRPWSSLGVDICGDRSAMLLGDGDATDAWLFSGDDSFDGDGSVERDR